MRGYGNLVGEEQSGHIKEVGIELYQQMLKDAIASLKDKTSYEKEDWSPILNIGLSIQLPETYIPDMSLRLSLYRRIAALNTVNEVENFAAEMVDRFGNLPEEAEHLLSVVKLKSLAKTCNVEKIDLGEKAIVLSFKNAIPANADKVLSMINKSLGQVKLRQDGKLLVHANWIDSNQIIIGLQKLLLSLV